MNTPDRIRNPLHDWPLDGRHLVEASAGTGKTWTICGLYLRLLLERTYTVQQILVVTFTNAATAELRERIRERIATCCHALEQDQLDGLDEFSRTLLSDAAVRGGSTLAGLQQTLRHALNTFDEASIFTIHGFCQRALSDTPFAAGLPTQIEQVGDDSSLILQAAQDAWRRHVAAGELGLGLVRLLIARHDSPDLLAALVKHRLGKPLAREVWPEGTAPTRADLSALSEACRRVCDCWHQASAQVADLVEAAVAAGTLNGNKTRGSAISKAVAAWNTLSADTDPLLAIDDKAELLSKRGLMSRVNKGKVPPQHAFFALADDYLQLRDLVSRGLEFERCALLRAMLDEAVVQVRQHKLRNRQQSFNDLLYSVHARLVNTESPWFAPALRERFPVALIDEFQDTDPLQFSIFDRIYPRNESSLFFVGDPKQAIYSFRQADLHTYLEARRSVTEIYPLTDNQRSSASLIAAMNLLFAQHPAVFMLEGLLYHPVGYGAKPRPEFVDATEPRAALHLWQLPDSAEQPLRKPAALTASANAAAGEIARLITQGAAGRIQLGGRGIIAGDIAVLVRSHKQGNVIKNALGMVGVGSVELGQESVFRSSDAEELERVLLAVLEPASERRLRSALATVMLGYDATAIGALDRDETQLEECFRRFALLRERWQRRGFGRMFRELLTLWAVPGRLLTLADGERRLTNLLHLAECLQQVADQQRTPEALLTHLQTQRQQTTADDAAQLRLESDQNLVRIVTIHKCKGLEYPLVFCPFLWDGHLYESDDYHAVDGEALIDYRGELASDNERAYAKAARQLEAAAESLRLIYVALTRAVFRCYLTVGTYTTRSNVKVSSRSLLNWMVAGAGMTPAQWFASDRPRHEVVTAWRSLADESGTTIRLESLPTHTGLAVSLPADTSADLRALSLPRPLPAGWRIGSYSSLMHGAGSERAAVDHDARSLPAPVTGSHAPRLDAVAFSVDDILGFPRGAEAGECIHAVFEHIDFTDPATWPPAVERALRDFPLRGGADGDLRWPAMLENLVRDVVTTDLVPGLQLSAVTTAQRLNELEFALPAARLDSAVLNSLLAGGGYTMSHLHFDELRGYLKGFIDLVFVHRGCYYVLDWKSNHLGTAVVDYDAVGMDAAMSAHGYHLQYLIYTVALHRFLRQRVSGYDYERHCGGVLYLFVRGVRPSWRDASGAPAGVFARRPLRALIEQLDCLFGHDVAAEGCT